MKEIIDQKLPMKHKKMSKEEALKLLKASHTKGN